MTVWPSRQDGSLVVKTTWQMKGKAIRAGISSWQKRSARVVVVEVEVERSCRRKGVVPAAAAAATAGAMLVAAVVAAGP